MNHITCIIYESLIYKLYFRFIINNLNNDVIIFNFDIFVEKLLKFNPLQNYNFFKLQYLDYFQDLSSNEHFKNYYHSR